MSGGSTPPAWTPPPDPTLPRAVRRLVAAAWRHPGLILLCALLGALAALALAPRHCAPAPGACGLHGAAAPSPSGAGPDPAPDIAGRAPPWRGASASGAVDIEALLMRAPPAAARFAAHAPQAAAALAQRRGGIVAGLAAGLVLGLLAAAARELRGDRMRSAREAERALGAPVLAAVPTLSVRARRGMLAPAARRAKADRR